LVEEIFSACRNLPTAEEKLFYLSIFRNVTSWMERNPVACAICSRLGMRQQVAFMQMVAIEQAPASLSMEEMTLRKLAECLAEIDDFYRELGGIVGYQREVLRLLKSQKTSFKGVRHHSPCFVDISQPDKTVRQSIDDGISAMPLMCEMYPLGGAADRLHLVDEKSGYDLPAAQLRFAERTLLERLVNDLQAREYLYFQRTGHVLTTPIAIMTSHEKNNHTHIERLLESADWFGRPKERFRLFVQPMVPVVDERGCWVWSASEKLTFKPGGHGMIWKLAKDRGIFDWLRNLGVKYALIRQINNPIAGIDYGLLAFSGIGVAQKKSFGFASCPRVCSSAEGMNVLIERRIANGYTYCVSNIEYTDFKKNDIQDLPLTKGSIYSRFTSNTNILFAHLPALEKAVGRCPFPGLILNLKKKEGSSMCGRLESAMQNIADAFVEKKKRRLPLQRRILDSTFITYNKRHKTISTAKKAFSPDEPFHETPENCFFDLMQAHRELLSDFCHYALPSPRTLLETLAQHPSFVFLFHPALGPLFEIIGQKIRDGRLADGSELVIDIADISIRQLDLDGSLQIRALQPLGSTRFLHNLPYVRLSNVRVGNRGVNWAHSQPFWKGNYQRNESLEIVLEGTSGFIAENVCFEGNFQFRVPDKEIMIIHQNGTALKIEKFPVA
jgi:hypothetical protein